MNIIYTALFLCFQFFFFAVCHAQSYPNKPIKLIVPFGPGGTTDLVARTLSQKLSASLGQQVVAENKVGAGSTIGTDFVAKSAPDGYTLLMISTTHTISPWIYKNLPYDPILGFTVISKLVDSPYILVVNPKFPVLSVGELIAFAKSSTKPINFASSGNGSSQHLLGELFNTLAGVKMQHIPYKSSAGATTELVGGMVDVSFVGIPNVVGLVKTGQLRAIAITSNERNSQLPDIPTMQESGLSKFDATVWLALVAPANMPKELVNKLNAEVNKILVQSEVQKNLIQAGLVSSPSTPEAMSSYLVEEHRRWGKVIASLDVKL
jgi:tripartite-type tricarboxylate transporter receptor subunit TctC